MLYFKFFRCTSNLESVLVATSKNRIEQGGILATRLCTHKEDVQQINIMKLNKLTGMYRILYCS